MEVLESKTYPAILSKQLQVLRQNDIACDAKLITQGGAVSAHKIVLLAASPVLSSRLSKCSQTGSDNNSIHIENSSINVVEKVVNFMYTGKLEISYEMFEMVLRLCEDLEITFAIDLCEKYKRRMEKQSTWGKTEQTVPDLISNPCTHNTDKNVERSNMDNKVTTGIHTDNAEVPTDTHSDNEKNLKMKSEQEESIPLKKLKLKLKLDPEIIKSFDEPTKTNKDTKDILKENPRLRRKNPRKSLQLQELISKPESSKSKKTKAKSSKKIHKHVKKKVILNERNDKIDNEVENEECDVNKVDKTENKVKDDSSEEDGLETDLIYTNKPISVSNKRKRKLGSKKARSDVSENSNAKRRYKQFPCSYCSKILTNHRRLAFHEFSKHGLPFDDSRYTMYPCPKEGCTYVSGSKSNLQTHLKSRHEEERPHTCEFCGKSFKLPNVLAIHLNIHTGNKLWKCEYCGEHFNQQSGLSIHVKRHHMGESTWGELCHLCSEKFLQKADLRWHLFKQHGQPLPDNYKVYECDICNYQTKSSQDLQRHHNAHNGVRQFNCSICNKSCSTKSQLKRHEKFHGEKKFKCTFGNCTYACVDSVGLSKHITLMHTHKNVKPYICPVCKYKTGVKGNLDKHIRQVHFLEVVTKHTVHLKMKYANFESGDIITKEGKLVATAKERQELYRRCMEENWMAIIPYDETDTSVKAILENENDKLTHNEDKNEDRHIIEEGSDTTEQRTLVSLKPMLLDLRQEPPSNHAVNLTMMRASHDGHPEPPVMTSIPNSSVEVPNQNVVYITSDVIQSLG